MFELLTIIIVFLIIIGILFVFRNYKKNNTIEGLTVAGEPAKFKHGIAGNASNYAESIKKAHTNLHDQLLIGKYRTDYENSVLHLDDYLSTLMLHSALRINPSNDHEETTKQFDNLSKLYNSKQALNTVMKHIDSN